MPFTYYYPSAGDPRQPQVRRAHCVTYGCEGWNRLYSYFCLSCANKMGIR